MVSFKALLLGPVQLIGARVPVAVQVIVTLVSPSADLMIVGVMTVGETVQKYRTHMKWNYYAMKPQ